MNHERWNRIQALFQDALDLPPEERDAYLAEACGDAPDLLHELTSLLAAATRASRDLTRPMSPKKPAPGQQFGPYRLLEVLGQGGMATVYKATDTRLERLVAVKVLFSPLARDTSASASLIQASCTRAVACRVWSARSRAINCPARRRSSPYTRGTNRAPAC